MSNTRQCFAHHFMTFEEYGLWTHAREVSYESGVFYFDGRKVAARFRNQGKRIAYRVAKSLADRGWFRTLRKSKRDKKTGIFKPTEYQPVSLEEWAAKRPKEYAACEVCKACLGSGTGTSPDSGTGEPESSPVSRNDQSRFAYSPVPLAGHNLKERSRKREVERNATRSWPHTFSDKPKPALGGATDREGNETKPRPVQKVDDYLLPLESIRQAVFEETGQRVFIPREYLPEIGRLVHEYARDEIVAAVKELLNSRSSPGPTFNWRGFAGWLLNSECPRLRTVLLARRLYPVASNHAEQIKKAASA